MASCGGVGFSCYIEACGIAAVRGGGLAGGGRGRPVRGKRLHPFSMPTGNILVYTRARHSHGQGHETTFAQLMSSWLGVAVRNRWR